MEKLNAERCIDALEKDRKGRDSSFAKAVEECSWKWGPWEIHSYDNKSYFVSRRNIGLTREGWRMYSECKFDVDVRNDSLSANDDYCCFVLRPMYTGSYCNIGFNSEGLWIWK